MEANGGAGVGYNFNEGEVSSLSVSGGVGYGIVGVGGSYDFANGGWNASAGLQSRTYGTAGIGYGSNGFNWYLGGSDQTVQNINESVQNRLLFGSGMFMTNSEFNGSGPTPESVRRAENLIARDDASSWSEEGSLPKDARRGDGAWVGQPKCNRFCQVTAGAAGGNIETMAKKAIAGGPGNGTVTNRPKPGTVMLISPKLAGHSGHGVLLGNNGDFLHARTGAGAVSTTGWNRFAYMTWHHSGKPITYVNY